MAVSAGSAVAAVKIATRCERAYWVLRRVFGVIPRFGDNAQVRWFDQSLDTAKWGARLFNRSASSIVA